MNIPELVISGDFGKANKIEPRSIKPVISPNSDNQLDNSGIGFPYNVLHIADSQVSGEPSGIESFLDNLHCIEEQANKVPEIVVIKNENKFASDIHHQLNDLNEGETEDTSVEKTNDILSDDIKSKNYKLIESKGNIKEIVQEKINQNSNNESNENDKYLETEEINLKEEISKFSSSVPLRSSVVRVCPSVEITDPVTYKKIKRIRNRTRTTDVDRYRKKNERKNSKKEDKPPYDRSNIWFGSILRKALMARDLRFLSSYFKYHFGPPDIKVNIDLANAKTYSRKKTYSGADRHNKEKTADVSRACTQIDRDPNFIVQGNRSRTMSTDQNDTVFSDDSNSGLDNPNSEEFGLEMISSVISFNKSIRDKLKSLPEIEVRSQTTFPVSSGDVSTSEKQVYHENVSTEHKTSLNTEKDKQFSELNNDSSQNTRRVNHTYFDNETEPINVEPIRLTNIIRTYNKKLCNIKTSEKDSVKKQNVIANNSITNVEGPPINTSIKIELVEDETQKSDCVMPNIVNVNSVPLPDQFPSVSHQVTPILDNIAPINSRRLSPIPDDIVKSEILILDSDPFTPINNTVNTSNHISPVRHNVAPINSCNFSPVLDNVIIKNEDLISDADQISLVVDNTLPEIISNVALSISDSTPLINSSQFTVMLDNTLIKSEDQISDPDRISPLFNNIIISDESPPILDRTVSIDFSQFSRDLDNIDSENSNRFTPDLSEIIADSGQSSPHHGRSPSDISSRITFIGDQCITPSNIHSLRESNKSVNFNEPPSNAHIFLRENYGKGSVLNKIISQNSRGRKHIPILLRSKLYKLKNHFENHNQITSDMSKPFPTNNEDITLLKSKVTDKEISNENNSSSISSSTKTLTVRPITDLLPFNDSEKNYPTPEDSCLPTQYNKQYKPVLPYAKEKNEDSSNVILSENDSTLFFTNIGMSILKMYCNKKSNKKNHHSSESVNSKYDPKLNARPPLQYTNKRKNFTPCSLIKDVSTSDFMRKNKCNNVNSLNPTLNRNVIQENDNTLVDHELSNCTNDPLSCVELSTSKEEKSNMDIDIDLDERLMKDLINKVDENFLFDLRNCNNFGLIPKENLMNKSVKLKIGGSGRGVYLNKPLLINKSYKKFNQDKWTKIKVSSGSKNLRKADNFLSYVPENLRKMALSKRMQPTVAIARIPDEFLIPLGLKKSSNENRKGFCRREVIDIMRHKLGTSYEYLEPRIVLEKLSDNYISIMTHRNHSTENTDPFKRRHYNVHNGEANVTYIDKYKSFINKNKKMSENNVIIRKNFEPNKIKSRTKFNIDCIQKKVKRRLTHYPYKKWWEINNSNENKKVIIRKVTRMTTPTQNDQDITVNSECNINIETKDENVSTNDVSIGQNDDNINEKDENAEITNNNSENSEKVSAGTVDKKIPTEELRKNMMEKWMTLVNKKKFDERPNTEETTLSDLLKEKKDEKGDADNTSEINQNYTFGLCNVTIDQYLKCKFCTFQCKTKLVFHEHSRIHLKRHNLRNCEWTCKNCNLYCSTEEKYKIHKRQCRKIKVFKCHKCSFRCYSKNKLFIHCKMLHRVIENRKRGRPKIVR